MKRIGIPVALGLLLLYPLLVLLSHAAASAETLKIGMIMPLSGPAAPWGVNMQTVLEIVADEFNAKGGLKAGNKSYMIKIVPYDDKYQAEAAATAANRLIYEDKVKYIFGSVSSAAVLAMQGVTEKEKTLTFNCSYTRRALSPDKPFSFRLVNTPFEFSGPQAAWIAKNRNVKTVLIANPNDETGREQLDGNRQGYEKAGIKILAGEYYERGAPDMLPLVTRIMRYNPDLIETSGSAPGDVANIAKVARAQGYKGLMSKLGGGGDTSLPAAPEALEGFIFNADLDADLGGGVARLLTEIRKRKPQIPLAGFVTNAYSTLMLLAKAMEDAKTVEDSQAVRDTLEKIKSFDGLEGKLSWTGKETYGIDHQLLCPMYLGEGVKGKSKILVKLR
jgi:branched-chain amino acid transport system substrate-binding protein